MLGTAVDTEADGQPEASAKADDFTGFPPDDEDGVEPTPGVNWTQGFGGTASLDVYPNGEGCVSAWVDWDTNGNFTDGFDQIIANAKISGDGLTAVSFNSFIVPVNPANKSLFIRVRFYPLDADNSCTSAKLPTGIANGGEIEDHFWGFGTTAVSLQGIHIASNSGWQIPVIFAALLLVGITLILLRRRQQA